MFFFNKEDCGALILKTYNIVLVVVDTIFFHHLLLKLDFCYKFLYNTFFFFLYRYIYISVLRISIFFDSIALRQRYMNSAEPTFIMVLSKLYSKILFSFFCLIFFYICNFVSISSR